MPSDGRREKSPTIDDGVIMGSAVEAGEGGGGGMPIAIPVVVPCRCCWGCWECCWNGIEDDDGVDGGWGIAVEDEAEAVLGVCCWCCWREVRARFRNAFTFELSVAMS